MLKAHKTAPKMGLQIQDEFRPDLRLRRDFIAEDIPTNPIVRSLT